jgi:hypothetical protein
MHCGRYKYGGWPLRIRWNSFDIPRGQRFLRSLLPRTGVRAYYRFLRNMYLGALRVLESVWMEFADSNNLPYFLVEQQLSEQLNN